MEQYKLIIRLCGSPDEELMAKIEQQNSPAMVQIYCFFLIFDQFSANGNRTDGWSLWTEKFPGSFFKMPGGSD